MDDNLNDKEQVELVKSWLRDNGPWLIAGVLVGAAGLWGWNAWQARKEAQAVQASTQYDQLIQALDRRDRAAGTKLADDLRRDFASSPYADQADLAMARSQVEGDELPKAAERLARVMNDSKDPELRLLARVRLARVQLAQHQPDQALGTLGGAEPGAFGAQFDEVRGDILLSKGDKAGALREYLQAKGTKTVGVIDLDALDLKIGDLHAQGVASPAAAPAATTAAPAMTETTAATPAATPATPAKP